MEALMITAVKRTANAEYITLKMQESIDLAKARGNGLTPSQLMAGLRPFPPTKLTTWLNIKRDVAMELAPSLKEIISNPPENFVDVNPTQPKPLEIQSSSPNAGVWRLIAIESTNKRDVVPESYETGSEAYENFKPYIRRDKNGEPILHNGQVIYLGNKISYYGSGENHKFL